MGEDGCVGSSRAKFFDGTGRGFVEGGKQGLVCSQQHTRRGGLPTRKWHIRPSRLLGPARGDGRLDA